MRLIDILKELDKDCNQRYILLTARYVDADFCPHDFVYKGCAVTAGSLLCRLPFKILEKDVLGFREFFTKKNYGPNKDGKIVKIDFEIVIEF